LCPLVLQIQLDWQQVGAWGSDEDNVLGSGLLAFAAKEKFEHFRPNFVCCVATFWRNFDKTKCWRQIWEDWGIHEEHEVQRVVLISTHNFLQNRRKHGKLDIEGRGQNVLLVMGAVG
jgi:hypothetical protein